MPPLARDTYRGAGPSAGRRTAFGVVALIGACLIGLLVAEGALRLLGERPFTPYHLDVTIEPGGSLVLPHPTRGFANRPGRFAVTFDHRGTAYYTNLPNGNRITRPMETYAQSSSQPAIWLFGCSFTYGWGLNDAETFPWKLQERLPGYDVQNFGVYGYGTIHSLRQLEEAFGERPAPAVAVLCYGALHEERNLLIRRRRKSISAHSKTVGQAITQPYARLTPAGTLEYGIGPATYRPFPFMTHSALVYLVERRYDAFEARRAHTAALARALVDEFAARCREHDVPFVLAAIFPANDMLAHAEEAGLPAVDLTLDLDQPGLRGPRAEGHPSSAATTQYADRLYAFLADQVLPGAATDPAPASPTVAAMPQTD